MQNPIKPTKKLALSSRKITSISPDDVDAPEPVGSELDRDELDAVTGGPGYPPDDIQSPAS
jgi:hypothetical protein